MFPRVAGPRGSILLSALLGAMLSAAPASAPPLRAPAPPEELGFDRVFTGRTMRVDYFHTSRGDTRIVALDRVVDDGPWAGSRTRLLDDTDLGAYRVEVIDRATHRVLYTRGFSTLFGEWETTPEAKRHWRTFHDSLRIPWPKMPVQVVLKRRATEEGFRELWATVIDPEAPEVNRDPPALRGTLDVLQETGPGAQRVDLLLLADGYTLEERSLAAAQARRLVEALFRVEPFAGRRESFNVRMLHVPTATAGVHRPQAGVARRTPLSTEYNVLGSERYLLALDNRALRDTAGAVPYDVLVVLANEQHYGGGGIFNAQAAVAAGNEFADYLFVHEFAHHFAGLGDEYYTSDVAYETGRRDLPEPWEPNITALKDPARLKWRDLVEPGTPLPTPWNKVSYDARAAEYQARRRALRGAGAPESELAALFREQQAWELAFFRLEPHAGRVGAFEGAGYETSGLYRPELDCVMFSRTPDGFCRVCRRALARVISLHAD